MNQIDHFQTATSVGGESLGWRKGKLSGQLEDILRINQTWENSLISMVHQKNQRFINYKYLYAAHWSAIVPFKSLIFHNKAIIFLQSILQLIIFFMNFSGQIHTPYSRNFLMSLILRDFYPENSDQLFIEENLNLIADFLY